MNIFKSRKFNMTILILILMTTISFGMLQVFSNKNIQRISVHALEGVNEKSKSDWTGGPDSYSCDIRGGLLSGKDAILELTVSDPGKLNITYTNSKGSLTITNSNAGFSFSASGNPTTEQNLTIGLGAGTNTIVITCSASALKGKGIATLNLVSLDRSQGIEGTDIQEGFGSADLPYILDEEKDFAHINKSLGAVYKIADEVKEFDFSGGFTPIGSASNPFTGTFNGNGKTIKNLMISSMASHGGMFAATHGANISNLVLENVNMIKNPNLTSAQFASSGFIVGVATGNTTINNVTVSGVLDSSGANVGGFVGSSDESDGVVCTDCVVSGSITTTYKGNIGGFSGVGGSYYNCKMYAEVTGTQQVGGFVGGYQCNSTFEDCWMAGTVVMEGHHSNNYPYWGILNGYGAWSTYTSTRSGQYINFRYSSSESVSAIDIFNSNHNPNGLAVEVPTTLTNGKYEFKQLVTINKTNADTSYAYDEYGAYGVTGNYGGFTIRFTMADGTYKYISTLDKAESKFVSTFDIDLGDLTSYEDNFASMTINTQGTDTLSTNSDNITMWGSAEIHNANDFEHLSWIVNGAIPTTFGTGTSAKTYNYRTIITLGVLLKNDIDLTVERKGSNGKVLNKNTSGDLLYQFYGFGKGEMYPYRGSIDGGGHALNVNMNFENAYILGIICCGTDASRTLNIKNLTVNGTITGRYRVGILGMNDNYERKSTIQFTDVINNANITAVSHVGAFVGEAQGSGKLSKVEAKIILNNCVNNGNITATAGDAGGFVGNLNHLNSSSTYGVMTINDCSNNGKVKATGYAGGFVAGIDNTITVQGTNINSGIIQGGSNKTNFYAGTSGTAKYSTTAGLKTIYKINLGIPTKTWEITSSGASIYNSSNEIVTTATYTADTKGIIYVPFANLQTFSGVSLSLKVDLLKTAITIQPAASNTDTFYNDANTIADYRKTMATSKVVPKTITLNDSTNVYETTSSNQSWVVKATIEFSDSSTLKDINLTINLSEQELNTNQLIFKAVSLTYQDYVFPTVTLSRITKKIEDYVVSAANLRNQSSGSTSEFTNLGTTTLDAYNAIYGELSATGFEDDLTRFNKYIANNGFTNIASLDVSKAVMDEYYSKIAKENGINVSNLQNVSVEYGEYTFNKEIEFTMLIGDPIKKTIYYEFSKGDINKQTLKATAQTTGIMFSVGDVVTCSYAEDVETTITKIEMRSVTIDQNVQKVFNGQQQIIDDVDFALLEGDQIDAYTLTYNGANAAINVGTYEVALTAISGGDAVFYTIPEYTKGSLTITPVKYTLAVEHDAKFDYDQNAHATDFTLTQTTSSYAYTQEDYTVTYTGTTKNNVEYSSTQKPVDAGSYTGTISFVNTNLQFLDQTANYFSFEIQPHRVTNITIAGSFTYNSKVPKIIFNVDPNFNLDTTQFEYVINDENGNENAGINFGSYKLQITNLGNPNYYVDNLIIPFDVNKAAVEIVLLNQSTTYGNEISLNQNKFEKKSGKVYNIDDNSEIESLAEVAAALGLVIKTDLTSNTNAGSYANAIYATAENENYDVTIIHATMVVNKRPVSIDFGDTTQFDYQAKNINDLIDIKMDGVIEEDKTDFVFEINYESKVVTDLRDVGDYTYSLVEHETFNNYDINQKSQTYSIIAQDLTITAIGFTRAYKQEITASDFDAKFEGIISPDVRDEICELSYIVTLNGEEKDYTKLEHGIYTIEVVKTDKDYGKNYNITCKSGTLTISLRDTYISANSIQSTTYNAQEIQFSAKLVDKEGVEIEGAQVEIQIKLDGNEVKTIKNVGKYVIDVSGHAGSNDSTATAQYEFEIYKNKVSTALLNLSKVYNGKAYVPEFNYTMAKPVENFGNIFKCRVLDKNKIATTAVAADDYFVEFYIDDESKDNYEISTALFDVKITPILLTIQINDREIHYGETFNVQDSTYAPNDAILPGESLNLTYSISDFKAEFGDYVLTAESNNPNYSVTIKPGQFRVLKRELGVTFKGESELIYNENGYANLLSAEVSNALMDDVYSVYYTDATNNPIDNIENVGEYLLVVLINDKNNYKFEDSKDTKITKTISISKKELNLDICVENKVYDGLAINCEKVLVDQQELPNEMYSVEYWQTTKLPTAPKDKGVYDLIIKETSEANNYKFINNTKQIEIFAQVVSIEAIEKEYTYTRSVIKPQLKLVDVIGNEDVQLITEYVATSGNFREVGDYKIKISGIKGDNVANYILDSTDEIVYSIVPVKIDVEIGNDSFTFTNKQLTIEDLRISFLSDFAIYASDYAVSTLPINAGKHTIGFYSLNSGIEFNLLNFDVKIEKANIQEVKLDGKTVVYNNQVHSLTVDKTILSNGVEINVQYTNNKHVDAGEYEVVATLTNENYNTKTLTAKLIISQASVSVPLTETLTFVYNAQQQGPEIMSPNQLWYNNLISAKYIGEHYSSIARPQNAGEYQLEIAAINSNNIKIVNNLTKFTIKTKAVTILSTQTQTTTYNAEIQQFKMESVGIIEGESVIVDVLYNGHSILPINAGEYTISFAGLVGTHANNYHIENASMETLFAIHPYPITVTAQPVMVVYGEDEKPLTYTTSQLLGNDSFSGELTREPGKRVNSYWINQGTLSAGDNYDLTFVKAIYSIEQRQLGIGNFIKEFTYNGTSQVPSVEFTNIVEGDINVARVKTIGDTINAGTYSLQFVLANPNYQLPAVSTFEIIINKLQASEKIVGLINVESDYNSLAQTPIAEIVGGHDYSLSYYLDNQPVGQMIDAGRYKVVVILDDQNFKGSKTFEFTINKIDYDASVLDDVRIEISSNTLKLNGIENSLISIDNINFVESKVDDLRSKTTYNVYIKVLEDRNHKTTTFFFDEISTCASAEVLNEQIELTIDGEIVSTDIERIKDLIKDCHNLSASEKEILNDENFNELKEKYDEYFNQINEEIQEIQIASNIVEFDNDIRIRYSVAMLSVCCVGMVTIKKRRSKHESNN